MNQRAEPHFSKWKGILTGRILPAFLCVILFSFSLTAATKTWTGTTNSDWNTGSNWGGSVPLAGDIANIPGGLTNYPVINNAVSITTLNINSAGSGATLTVTTGGTLTASGLITVNANGSLVITGGIINTAGITSSNIITISGGTILSTVDILLNSGAVLNQSGGLIHMAAATGTNPGKNVTPALGAIVNQSGGTMEVKDVVLGGTFNQTGSSALLKVFHDFKPVAGSVFNATAGTFEQIGTAGGSDYSLATVQFNNYLIDAGMDPLFTRVACSFPVSGDFTNNNSGLSAPATNTTVVFNGTGNQAIYSASAAALFTTFDINKTAGGVTQTSALNVTNFTLDGGSYSTSATNYALTVGGNVTLNGGALNVNNSTVAVTGNFTHSGTSFTAGTATLNITGNYLTDDGAMSTSSSTLTIAGNWTNNNVSYSITPGATTFTGALKTIGGTQNTAFSSLSITGTVTMNNSNSSTGLILPVNANTANLTIATGATLTINGDVTIAQPSASKIVSLNINAGTVVVNGNVNLGGSNTSTGRISEIYITNGSLTVTGNLVYNAASGVNVTSVIDMSAGSGNLLVGGNFSLTNGAGTLTPGTTSTVTYNGTGSQSVAAGGAITYNFLTINKASGTATFSASLGVVDLNLLGGTLNSAGNALTISGNVLNNGGTMTGSPATTFTGIAKTISGTGITDFGTVTFNNGKNYTISNSNTCTGLILPAGGTTSSLTQTGSGVLTVNGNVTIAQPTSNNRSIDWLINSGTATVTGSITIGGTNTTTSRTAKIVITTGTLNANGNIVYNSSATTAPTAEIDMSGGAGRLNLQGNLTLTNGTGTLIPGPASTVNFNGTSAQSVSFASAIRYNNIYSNNATTVTSSGAITSSLVTGDILIQTGTFSNGGFAIAMATGKTLGVDNGATLKLMGTTGMVTGTSIIKNFGATSTVEYGGTNQTVSNETYGHLTLSSSSGAAVKTMPGAALSIAGNLTSDVASGSSVSFTALANITVAGNVTIGASTTFNGSTFSHNVGGNWTNNGTYTVSTSTVTMSGASTTISGTGTLAFYNLILTGSNISAGAVNISVAGDLSSTGVGSFTHASGGALTMSGTGKSISGTGFTFNDLTLNGTITTTSTCTVTGNLSAGSGGSFTSTAGVITMSGASKTITASGSISLYDLSVTGSVTTATSFTITAVLAVPGSLTASAGTATFTGTSLLSGTANLYNVTINGTSLQLSMNSVLGIAGVYTITSGSLDVTTTTPNTVNFNGILSRTIASGTFYHLVFTGNTNTAGGSLTVNGDLTIASSTTFVAGSYTHYIKGNFINNSTFTAGAGTVEFNGAADATIIGATTFNIININKAASTNIVNVASNLSVATINMTLGTVSTGTNTLNITTTRTGAGIILGYIQRTHTFTTGVAYEFEGQSNTITFSAVSGVTSVLVKVSKAAISDFPFGGSMNRLYDITVPSGTYTATLRLHYDDADANGNNEGSVNLWKYTSNWVTASKSSNNTTANWVEQTGLTNIATRWTFSDDNNVISWNGSVSSNWNTAANWTAVQGTPGSVPTSNDIVQIGVSTYTNAPVISTAAVSKSITFGSAQASTLSLTTGGSLTTQGNISGTWTGNATHTINTNNQNITVNGNIVLSDGTASHAINLNIGTGTVIITGALTESGGANITFSGAGGLVIGSDFTYVSGTFTKSTGTVTYNGSALQSVAAVNYNNLVVNKSGVAAISSATTISGDVTVTAGELDINAASTITGNVTIASGATLASGSVNNSVGGNWSNSGTFTPGSGMITLNGSLAQTVSASTFNNFTINKVTGTAILGNITINGSISLLSGSMDLSTFTANRNTLGGTFSMSNGTTLYLAGAANFPSNYATYTLGASSTVNYNGTIAQTVAAVNYGNLLFTNGTTNAKTLAASTTINGDVTINSGATFNAGAYTLNVSGNWTTSGTFTPATSTVNMQGTSKSINGNTTFNKLSIFGSYSVPGNDLTMNGLFFIASGAAFAATTGTLTVSGDITNNGTFTSTGTTTFTGTGAQIIQFANPVTLNVVNFNGTISPTMASTATNTYATVNINNTGGVTSTVNWLVTTAFNVASGASFNGSTGSHTFNGSFTNNGSVSSAGTLNFIPSLAQTIKLQGAGFTSTGTVVFGGTGAITVTGTPTTLTNVTIANTTGVTPAANWTLGNNFLVNTNCIFNAGTFSYTIGGNLLSGGTINGGTSTYTMTAGAGSLSGNSTTTFYDLVISGTISAIADFNVSHNFTNNGSYDGTLGILKMTGNITSVIGGTATTYNLAQLSIQKSAGVSATLAHNLLAVASLDVTSGILDASTYTISQDATNGGTFSILPNATFKIGGTNTLPTFNTYSLDSLSTVEYNGGVQSLSSATSYGNLVISAAGNKTAGAAISILKNFTLTNGTFVGGAFTHTVGGNWNMSSGAFTNTGTTITLNGTLPQTVSSTGTFNNLIVNKGSADVTLNSNITVAGTLTFTLGKINTGSYIVISTSGTVCGAAQGTGWVNGNMQRTFGNGTNITGIFYVGGASNYSPVTLIFASVTGGGGAITTGNSDGMHPNISGSTITADKAIPRYWTVTNTGGIAFTSYAISLTWNTAENFAGLNSTLLKVGKYTSSAWTLPTVTGTATTSNVQANGITTFGDFIAGQTCDVPSTFSYTGTPYCSNAGTATVTFNSGGVAGSFTASPSGLSINASTGAINLAASTAGTYTVTNTTTGTGGCTTVSTATVVIQAAPSATISYAGSPFCTSSGSGAVTRTGTSGGTYSAGAGLSINAANGLITPTSSTPGTYTVTYTIAASGGCSLFQATTSVSIVTAGTWSGAVSTAWNTSGNWVCGAIPTGTTNVIIPGSLTNYPVINSGIASVQDITIQSGGVVTVTSGTLQIAGTISNSGTFTASNGTVEFNGSSAQTIPAATFAGNKILNLVISNNVTLAGQDSLTGVFSFGNVNSKTFTTGGYLTLKSTATNTASIADITNNGVNSGNTISGNVTVERYISALSNRAYRLLGPSVNSGTSIHANWQEGATSNANNPNPGYGTHITGTTVDQTNGFDATTTASASMFTYNQVSGAWVGAANTNSTTFNTQTGYLVYIRGDRTINLYSQANPLPTTNTTLRATGTLATGTQTFSGLAGNNKFSLITNPYASAVNWGTILPASTGLTNFYTLWDPNYGTRGGFVTVSTGGVASSGVATNNIQSGQAFFVQASGAASPVVNIRETDKTATNNIDVFSVTHPLQTFATSLYYAQADGSQRIADGATAVFDDTYSLDFDGNDAEELANWDENIAITRNGKNLGIESRPVITGNDTMFLYMTHMKVKDYSFLMVPANLSLHGITAEMVDNFTGTRTPVSLTDSTTVPFTVTAASASAATNRFYIVFKSAGVLPVTLTGVSAARKNSGVEVDWQTQAELNVDRYEIERSADGQSFVKAGSVMANGNISGVSSYSWYDANPYAVVNYYRIRSVDKNGSVTYSRIVKVVMDQAKATVTIAANPVTGNTIVLQLKDLPKGNYNISISNKLGQQLYSQVVTTNGGATTTSLNTGSYLSAGTYQLKVEGKEFVSVQQLIKN